MQHHTAILANTKLAILHLNQSDTFHSIDSISEDAVIDGVQVTIINRHPDGDTVKYMRLTAFLVNQSIFC